MVTLSRVYPDGRVARAVVDELKAAGLSQDDIGIIASSRGAAGLPASQGAFVLPGIGAVVAAGWLVSALAGAVAGAGGIVGALIEAGAGEIEASRLAEAVKRGGTLVTVRVAGQDRDYYESIMAITEMPKPLGPAGMPMQLRDLNTLIVKRP